jgi:Fe-S oxidoreductase
MTTEGIILLVVFVGVLIAFGYVFRMLIRTIRLGQPEDRYDRLGERIKSVIVYVVAQTRVLSQLAGLGHFVIFWGFIFITLGTFEHILSMIFPVFSYQLILGHSLAAVISGGQDILGILVLGALIVTAVRRYIFKPERLKIDDPKAAREAGVVLLLIFVLIILMYGFRGTSVLMDNFTFTGRVAPVTHYVASVMEEWGMNLTIANSVFAWSHHVIIFFFLLYIPFSKHDHILFAIPNVFLRNLDHMGSLSKMDFEDETAEKFGVSEVQDYTWKQLLDLFSCTECGRCQVVCPAYLTDKPLSPYRIIHNLRGHLMKEKDKLLSGDSGDPNGASIIPDVISEDEIWACTTCGACMEKCPPFIEHVQKIVDLRRNLVLMESKFPSEVTQVFKNMEVNYNPWSMGYASRADWTKGVNVPLASDKGEFDVLLWVGCAGSFDDRGQKIAKATVELLKMGGVDFAILGVEEKCCGETARRMGNEYLAHMLIEGNIENLKKYKFNTILTICPHGLNTFTAEYPEFGYRKPVVHHSQFLLHLMDSGRLELNHGESMKGAYHDSCYLGRYNNIINQPREILRRVNGVELKEFDRKKRDSFCCGAGGGRMWMEEDIGRRINEERVDEFINLKTDYIFTACPFCMTMFEDGVKSREREEDITVLDIAEVLYQASKSDS